MPDLPTIRGGLWEWLSRLPVPSEALLRLYVCIYKALLRLCSLGVAESIAGTFRGVIEALCVYI